MKRLKASPRFVLCIRAAASVDVEQRKVYQLLPDRVANRDGYVRVIDESGEDYLYPAEYFVPVRLPAAVTRDLDKSSLINGPANTALQPTVAAHHRSRKMRLRAARG